MDMMIGFPEGEALAGELAAALNLPLRLVTLHRFPDGESLVRLEGSPRHPVILRSLDRPNDKLVELVFLAGALRERGAETITLVAPYLPYMRQDIEFRPGEVVSQRIMGQWLGSLFDRIIAVEPHLHRTHDLREVFPACRQALALTAAPLLGAWARAQGARDGDWVVLGPDEEAEPLVQAAAQAAGVPGLTGRKTRHGDHDVSVRLPTGTSLAGKNVLIVDDVVSSGGTLIDAARLAREQGAARLLAATTHALFPPATLAAFREAGIEQIVSTDGVRHPSNAISLCDLLVTSLRRD